MDEKTRDMMEKILESDRIGYTYFYPLAGGDRQEFFISTTAENIVKFLSGHMFDAEKVIITDVLDRLILDTCGGFLNNCPDQDLCREIIPYLAPIQQGEALKEKQKTFRNHRRLAEQHDQRLKDMDNFLQNQSSRMMEFDNDLVRRLIGSIKVESEKDLVIQFQSGIVMEQEIRYE